MGSQKKNQPKKKRSNTVQLIEYFFFRCAVCVIDILPMSVCVAFAESMATFMCRCLPKKWTRHHVARENIRTAFGDKYNDAQVDELIRRMWVHLFRMVAEIVQVPRKLRSYNSTDIFRFRHRDETMQAVCSGRPVMILSGHFGNWEMAVSAFGVFGFPIGVVARDLDNIYLHNWFRRFREYTGHRLISKKGGGGEIVDVMEKRGLVALLGDQDAGSSGMFVPFFGKDASTFKSIALLAMQFDAVICVGYTYRLADDFRKHRWARYEMGTEEIIDPRKIDSDDLLREITSRYTSALERIISAAPEQYFWVHRRWKSVPRQRKRRNRKAVAA